MGEFERARELDEDMLARQRRALGESHPDTLDSAARLALSLSSVGEHRRAQELIEDVLVRRRRVFADDHPDIVRTVAILAIIAQ